MDRARIGYGVILGYGIESLGRRIAEHPLAHRVEVPKLELKHVIALSPEEERLIGAEVLRQLGGYRLCGKAMMATGSGDGKAAVVACSGILSASQV